MTQFLRFITAPDARVVFIDPDNIVMISEHRYRINDIGHVGTTITFRIGSSASSINVNDDPDSVYHHIRKGDIIYEQEIALAISQTPETFKTRVYRPDGTSYVYPDEQKLPTVCSNTPSVKPQPVPSIEDFIDYIDNHPINRIDKPEPGINHRVRPESTTYQTPPQETPPCNGNGEAQSTEG